MFKSSAPQRTIGKGFKYFSALHNIIKYSIYQDFRGLGISEDFT